MQLHPFDGADCHSRNGADAFAVESVEHGSADLVTDAGVLDRAAAGLLDLLAALVEMVPARRGAAARRGLAARDRAAVRVVRNVERDALRALETVHLVAAVGLAVGG